MRTLFFLAFLSVLGTCVRAQVLTVSDELTMRTDTEYNLVGKVGGQVLLLQDRDTKYLLTAYDRNMRQSWEKELELRGKNIRIIETVSRQDGTGFYLAYLFRQKGRNFLQVDRYNPAGDLRDSTTLLDFGTFASVPSDDVFFSEDETKMLLLIAEQSTEVRCIGVDLEAMELLYDRLLAPKKFFFGDDYVQAEIANDGQSFFVINRDNFRSKKKDHRYEIVHIDPRLPTVEQIQQLYLGDSLTYDIYFTYDNANEKLVAGGLYTTRDFTRSEGYFFVSAPPTEEKAVPVFTPFPLQLIKNVEGKRYNKKTPGIAELSVREIVLRQDGGALLITERNRQFERRSNASRLPTVGGYNVRPMLDYHYEEMVVFSIHADGEPHWSNILHKKQYSQDDGGVFSSYLLMQNPRSLRFLFNDEIRFENTVSEYVVNGRGEFDRNSLFHTRDLDLRLRFRDGVQVAANEVILPSEHRNKLRLVKMTYAVK